MALVGVLGTLPFVCASGYVMTFSDFSRSKAEKFAKHEVLGKRPTLEWTGTDADGVDMTIRLDSTLGMPPLAGLQLLKFMLESHEPHALVIGADYFGTFVIESMDEDRQAFTGFGITQVAEVRLKLVQATEGWA